MSTEQPETISEDDKPLTYSQRFKKECSNAAGLCFWDRVVESFKVKGKNGEQAPPPGPTSYHDNTAELQREREGFETELENQREHFLSQLNDKDELLTQQHQEFEQRLQQTQQDYEQRLHQADNTIEELRQELRKSGERAIEIQNISELIQQYEFVVPDFSQLRKRREKHTVPPMYTKPGGYKFILEIIPAGTKSGSGSDVSVMAYTQKGENDANLAFPAKMNITLQLLNQQDKTEGHTRMIACVYKSSANGEFLGSVQQFISLAELDQTADVYLRNDQLWFRVTEIQVDTLQNS